MSQALLTVMKEPEVRDVLLRGGFVQAHGSYQSLRFSDLSEIVYSGNSPTVQKMRGFKNGDVGAAYFMRMAYACGDANLRLPETAIVLPSEVIGQLLKLPNSKALETLRKTNPLAIYDDLTRLLKPDLLARVQDYKPQ